MITTERVTATLSMQASITTLTIDGITITKDIARQLDQLGFGDWENFEPLGRVRTGINHYRPGIELLGRDTTTGALVRMFHATEPVQFRTFRYWEDGEDKTGIRTYADTDLRNTLTSEYSRMPLILLPREGRRD